MLTVQAMQYESLQERINEARRAKHDVRHHITLMQEYLANGNYDALGDCLSRYRRCLPDGALISAKHRGLGLGTKSVRGIAGKCGGICRFEAKDGVFYASVMCPLQ